MRGARAPASALADGRRPLHLSKAHATALCTPMPKAALG